MVNLDVFVCTCIEYWMTPVWAATGQQQSRVSELALVKPLEALTIQAVAAFNREYAWGPSKTSNKLVASLGSLCIGVFGSLPGTSLSEQPSKELKAGEGDSCCWHCSKHVGQPALVEANQPLSLIDFFADEPKTVEGSQASDMHLGAHNLMRVRNAGGNGLYTTTHDEVSYHDCQASSLQAQLPLCGELQQVDAEHLQR